MNSMKTTGRFTSIIGTTLRYGMRRVLRRGGTFLMDYADRISDKPISTLEKELLSRNQCFKNKHKQRRCFVIGNGPSLNSQDLAPLGDELTFVMSSFWKHPVVEEWQPSYYFFADPVFADGSESMRTFFSDLRSQIHSSVFFLPLQAREMFLEGYEFPDNQSYFALLQGNLGESLGGLPNFTKVVPGVQSVSQMAIMAAMYMGCSPIYLLGLDHDWLAKRGMDRHFYEGKTVDGHAAAHGNLDAVSYKSDLAAALNLWNGYENLKQVADQCNIQIINATDGGFLDVFPRAKYETLFDLQQ